MKKTIAWLSLSSLAAGCSPVSLELIRTGSTGTGGADAGGCITAADCPGAGNVCVMVTCEPTTHTCTMEDVPDGGLAITNDAGTSGLPTNQCDELICNGNGKATAVPIAGSCNQNGGTVCGDPGGSNAGICVECNVNGDCQVDDGVRVCSTASTTLGTCVACNVATDCPMAGDLCKLNLCVSSVCGNGVQEPGETDVGCGGGNPPGCPPCPDGEKCLVNSDCQSDDCNPGSLTCTPASCNDGILNEGETDVDCGGPVCGVEGKKCGTGQKCAGPAYGQRDCQSFNCQPTTTDAGMIYECQAPTCFDGIQNEGETDVDCGGTHCPGCPVGDTCEVDADCAGVEGCDKITKTCDPNQCNDGLQNNSETDVDCGGGSPCPTCPVGDKCMVDADCTAPEGCDKITKTCDPN